MTLKKVLKHHLKINEDIFFVILMQNKIENVINNKKAEAINCLSLNHITDKK